MYSHVCNNCYTNALSSVLKSNLMPPIRSPTPPSGLWKKSPQVVRSAPGNLRTKKQAPKTDRRPTLLFLLASTFSEKHRTSVRLKKQCLSFVAGDESLSSPSRDNLRKIVSVSQVCVLLPVCISKILEGAFCVVVCVPAISHHQTRGRSADRPKTATMSVDPPVPL